MGVFKYPYTWHKSDRVQFARSLDTVPYISCLDNGDINIDIGSNRLINILEAGNGRFTIYEDGNGATISTATDKDFFLKPQGTGKIKFGTHAAITTETNSGYITIKDDGGTERKLCVVS